MIDPRAVVHPGAKLADDVEIGPFAIIGDNVELGPGCWVGPHAVVNGPSKIGARNKIFQFASVGERCQDKKFTDADETWLIMGDDNVVREGVTIHRGTVQDEGITKIGNDNLFMAYVHVAHDCVINDHCIFANMAALAGHVLVDDYAIISGFCGIHQFCQIGAHSFIADNSMVGKDVPPYVMTSGRSGTSVNGINIEGLKRRGFSAEAIQNIKRAYRVIYRNGLGIKEAIEQLEKLAPEQPEVMPLVQFMKRSKRGILR